MDILTLYLLLNLSGAGNMGYHGAMPGAGMGAEFTPGQFYLRGEYSHTFDVRKVNAHGSEENFKAESFYRCYHFAWIGGGAGSIQQDTNLWQKGSIHPIAGFLLRGQRPDFFLDYVFSGTDRTNRVHGIESTLEIKAARWFVPYVYFAALRSNPTFSRSPIDWGASASVGARIIVGVWSR